MAPSNTGIDFSLDRIDPSIQGAARKELEEHLDNNGMTQLLDFVEENKQALDHLNAQLAARNIRLGHIIGAGSSGGVTFNMLDQDGQVIPSVVLRVDCEGLLDLKKHHNPSVILPIHHESVTNDDGEKGYFGATIVPRAHHIKFDEVAQLKQSRGDGPFTVDELKKHKSEELDLNTSLLNQSIIEHSLPISNVDGLIPYMHDYSTDQYMCVPGIETKDGKPIPVMTDIGGLTNTTEDRLCQCGVEQFAEVYKFDLDKILATKASDEEVARLRDVQQKIDQRARGELAAAGVQLDDVPTKQDPGAEITPVDEKKRASGKG